MSTSKLRKNINFKYTDTHQYIILECLKSESVSSLIFHTQNGTKERINGTVASWHSKSNSDKGKSKPKTLSFPIDKEGVYEIIGQQLISGLYCIYKGAYGRFYYSPIDISEKEVLFEKLKEGISYKDSLSSMGKTKLF
ncbi:hypothetical protein [Klebsiella michiganensis]|uniref:hypothetical protein n=1 Tax=Klebsiella michiganensis TaxID=1134687 RepID=UPI001118ABC6|nr:hypothetical protein [Klebsiella michiganensis]HEJ7948608.1 hypothetical protein [Serratia liquefaciens]